MRSATREKEVRDLKMTCKYQAGLKASMNAHDDYACNPWYTKGFTRA